MRITGVFAIRAGLTTLSGFVTPAEFSLIGTCECELRIESVPATRFRLGGEMIHRSPHGMRSVWTSEKVDVGLIEASVGRCTLKGLGEWYPS